MINTSDSVNGTDIRRKNTDKKFGSFSILEKLPDHDHITNQGSNSHFEQSRGLARGSQEGSSPPVFGHPKKMIRVSPLKVFDLSPWRGTWPPQYSDSGFTPGAK
jgi:hypothetical protein